MNRDIKTMPIDKSVLYDLRFVGLFVESLPFWRRFLARYFDKYKITAEEYEEWLLLRMGETKN